MIQTTKDKVKLNTIKMEEEKETPRSLIRGMLDHKVDMDTTVRITRQAVKDASDKRSSRQHSQSATAELPIRKVQIGQQRQSVSLSEVTPRTLVGKHRLLPYVDLATIVLYIRRCYNVTL